MSRFHIINVITADDLAIQGTMTLVLEQGPVSISDKTSYRKISLSVEAARLVDKIIASHRNLHCCQCTCQISERLYSLKYKSCGFETLRDLTITRLSRVLNGVLILRNRAAAAPLKFNRTIFILDPFINRGSYRSTGTRTWIRKTASL